MNPLKQFFEDKAMMKAWAEFIVATLNQEILDRTYAGKPIEGFKEAHDIIDKSFRKLAVQFKPKPKPRNRMRAE